MICEETSTAQINTGRGFIFKGNWWQAIKVYGEVDGGLVWMDNFPFVCDLSMTLPSDTVQ